MKTNGTTQWHLEKTVSISHILTTVIICMTFVGAWYSTTERVAILETHYSEMNERIVRLLDRQSNADEVQDNGLKEFRADMRQDVATLSTKIDNVLSTILNLHRNDNL